MVPPPMEAALAVAVNGRLASSRPMKATTGTIRVSLNMICAFLLLRPPGAVDWGVVSEAPPNSL